MSRPVTVAPVTRDAPAAPERQRPAAARAAGPLASLIAPRTVRLVDDRCAGIEVLRRAPCRVVRSPDKPVDVEVWSGPGRAPRPRAASAKAVLAPAGGVSNDDRAGRLLLGAGCGLWTSALDIGVAAGVAETPRAAGAGCLILTQGRSLAAHLVACAASRPLGLCAAIATGDDSPTAWDDLVHAATEELDGDLVLLLGLHRPVNLERLLRAGRARSTRVGLLLVGQAALAASSDHAGLASPPVDVSAVAAALGWVPVKTISELVEVGWLLCRGATPPATLRARSSAADETALLGDAVARAGLDPTAVTTTTTRRRSRRRQRGRQADTTTLLVESTGVSRDESTRRSFSLAVADRAADPLADLDVTLAAVAALQRARPPRSRAPRPAPAHAERKANQLLDFWSTELSEPQVNELLACFGIPVAPTALVRSASAASSAARELGFPVSLRAVGSTLRWQDPSCLAAADTAAATRQAFHDLLDRCRARRPLPVVDGVVISRQPHDHDIAIECTLLWLGHDDGGAVSYHPLLLVTPAAPSAAAPGARGGAPRRTARTASEHTPAGRTAALICPFDQDEASALLESFSQRPDHRRVRGASRVLLRFGDLATTLSERMIWLRIARLVPGDRPGAAVHCVGCDALQRHHLRGLSR